MRADHKLDLLAFAGEFAQSMVPGRIVLHLPVGEGAVLRRRRERVSVGLR